MILGLDFAGTVVAAGPKVDGYRMGDDVVGRSGSAAPTRNTPWCDPAIALKPPSVSFAEAAAVTVR